MPGQRAFWNARKETRRREERESEVLGLMQRQLHYAYDQLPFYRRHYDRAGFHPDMVTSIASFTERVPIITKQMLATTRRNIRRSAAILGRRASISAVCTARPAPAASRRSMRFRATTGTTSPT